MDLRSTEKQVAAGGCCRALPGSNCLRNQAAFTLLEIVLAILILAGSLMTLLGLQTATIERAIRDRNQRQAMLIARSILTAIEVDPEVIENQDTTNSADKLLRELTSQKERDEEAEEIQQDFQASLKVDSLEIPVKEDQLVIMKQIVLTVFWGETRDETLEVIYFTPTVLPDLEELADDDDAGGGRGP